MLWLLANLFIRSALILGVAALLCGSLGRSLAQQRHRMLLSAFILLAVWPLLAAVLPEISLPVFRGASNTSAVTVEQFTVSRRAAPAAHSVAFSPLLFWLCAATTALAPLVMAHLRLHALVRRAVPGNDETWALLLNELSAQLGVKKAPELLVYPGALMPMVFGVWRPRIVLPDDCCEWPAARRRVVLLHELAHIARRDLMTQSFARLVAACWWFQPLAWIALRSLRRESERACDELVIRAGVKASDYAAELLAIARSFPVSRHASPAGIAMARADDLERRLRALLDAPLVQSKRAGLAAVFLLAALTITASAVTLSPETQPPPLGGHAMKNSLLAGLLTAAGLSAATIGGSVYDSAGVGVANATASLVDFNTNAKFETTTTADGKFTFEALPPGEYVLRVRKPGFATLFREFEVDADGKVDRSLTLTPPSSDIAASPHAQRIGGRVAQANLLTKVPPVYPPTAKAAHIQGTVLLEVVISKDGEPLSLRVISSPDSDLTQSALEAVRQWRYRPTLLNGNPIEVVTEVTVNYTLSQ